MRFFKKIQDWILKSEIIRKRILRFFTQQINPRSFGSRCLKGAEESTPGVDSSVPLIHHDPRDLGLICLVKKRKIRFRILSDLRIQSWIFLKKRTLSVQLRCLFLDEEHVLDQEFKFPTAFLQYGDLNEQFTTMKKCYGVKR